MNFRKVGHHWINLDAIACVDDICAMKEADTDSLVLKFVGSETAPSGKTTLHQMHLVGPVASEMRTILNDLTRRAGNVAISTNLVADDTERKHGFVPPES